MEIPKKVHFIGICGKGMAGLAIILREKGFIVSGSDEGFYDPLYSYLVEQKINFIDGYKKENIPNDVSLIVIGKHAKLVAQTNEEVAAAYEMGVPVKSFPEVIDDLTKETDNTVVCGSFGKSSCTAFLVWTLLYTKKDPSYFIGALPYNFKNTAHQGIDKTFILEGDEYPSSNTDATSKFLYYNPKTVLLTSCEHDHINVFPTLADYLQPFEKLTNLLKDNDLLIKNLNGANIEDVTKNVIAKQVTYSLSDEKANYYARNISYGEKTVFDLYNNGNKLCTLETNQLGSYMVENIVGCGALLLEKKLVSIEQLQKACELFLGVAGRMDKKENTSSVLVYEAFGSSQSKLASSFEALKLHFPNKKIIALFEPHTFSWRNKNALSWYTHTFDDAKHVLVFEPPSHGANNDQLSLDEIVSKIRENHDSVFPFHNSNEGLEILKNIVQKDDIVLLVTSGDLGGIIPQVPKLMEELF